MKNEHWYELDMLLEGQKTNELKLSQNSKFSMIKRRAKYYFEGQPRCYSTCFEIIVVKLAHIGHPGLVKTKSLLRSKLSMVAEQLDFAFLVSQFIKNQNHRQ